MGESSVPDQPPPPDPQSAASGPPAEGEQGKRWWEQRAALIAGAIAALLGVVGLVVGGVALAASSSTRSDVDAIEVEVEQVEAEAADIEAERDAAVRQLDDLVATSSDVADAVDTFASSTALAQEAGNALVSLNNRAVGRINAGATQEGVDIARGQGSEAVDDFQAAVDAQRAALSDLQMAIKALEEVVDGA